MKTFRIFILCILTLCARTHSAAAQTQWPLYSFQAALSQDTIQIGDQLDLRVTATVPQGYEVLFPTFADTLAKGIELLKAAPIDTQKLSDNRMELTYRLLITSFDSGVHRIPPFVIPFGQNKTTDTARTSSMGLTVLTLPRDTTMANIYDIKPPLAEPITIGEVARWAGIVLLAAGFIALIVFYFIRRKQNRPIVLFQKPMEPAHVIALRKLQKVADGKMWVTDNHKHYHSMVTEIVREYIELRFQIPALEQTTLEILQTAKSQSGVHKSLLEALFDSLSLSDLVKFAKYTPSVAENEELLRFAYRFVNETLPTEVEKGKPSEGVISRLDNAETETTATPSHYQKSI